MGGVSRCELQIERFTNIVTTGFKNFSQYVNSGTNPIIFAPEGIVKIRNAIVHSNEEKRKQLNKIPDEVKSEALQICLWYIELSILKILNFEGEYYNRCFYGRYENECHEIVPWKKK